MFDKIVEAVDNSNMFNIKQKVVLNAGHSVFDPGAIADGYREADLAMSIRDKILLLMPEEIEVIKIPDDLNLSRSVAKVNYKTRKQNSGLAVSVHLNTALTCQGHGAEIFHYPGDAQEEIAEIVLDNLCETTDLKKRRVKPDTESVHGKLSWVRDTKPYALLIEAGFIDSKRDIKKIAPEWGQMLIAEGIVKGVCEVLEVDYERPEGIDRIVLATSYLQSALDILKNKTQWQK